MLPLAMHPFVESGKYPAILLAIHGRQPHVLSTMLLGVCHARHWSHLVTLLPSTNDSSYVCTATPLTILPFRHTARDTRLSNAASLAQRRHACLTALSPSSNAISVAESHLANPADSLRCTTSAHYAGP